MSDYFKTALAASGSKLIGSFDDRKNEYNLTIPMTLTTVSFKESVNGWSSFKSFIPEQALSMGNDYYSLKSGLPYKHHVKTTLSGNPVDRNTFYGEHTPSSVSVLLNDMPSVIKSYKNLSYEGSQSKVLKEDTDVNTGYYNLEAKPGWFTTTIKTDKQEGKINEFIEKEGKWFNYIKGTNFEDVVNLRTKEFSFQGIGVPTNISVDNSLYPPIPGCTDPRASNYNPNATVDDGSCFLTPPNNPVSIGGCMDPSAPNYDPAATYDNGSCEFICPVTLGCTDPTALNYDPLATTDDGSCILPVYGCTDPLATNYDAAANVNDGSCTYAPPPGGGGGIGGGTGTGTGGGGFGGQGTGGGGGSTGVGGGGPTGGGTGGGTGTGTGGGSTGVGGGGPTGGGTGGGNPSGGGGGGGTPNTLTVQDTNDDDYSNI
jgi:NAD-dependent dihydropyrimidine dehydrogenase PreA subunit